MKDSKTPTSGGIGFCGALAIAFIVLKLMGIIAWSWWWVLAPLWAPLAVVLVIAAILGLISVLTD